MHLLKLTNHIETSHVAVEAHVFFTDLYVVVRVHTVGSHEETEDA